MDNNLKLHNFDLSSFAKAHESMVATNDRSYNGSNYGVNQYNNKIKNYTEEEVKRIIESGSISEQQQLSRNYFAKDGYYKQIIIYYATLLKYSGILIPNPTAGKNLSTPHIQKKYYSAMDYVDKMNLQTVLTDWAQKILVNGTYYGVIIESNKTNFSVLDLPAAYCHSRFKDYYGNDIIEFNLSYFNTITDKELRDAAFKVYPDFIIKAYRKWSNGKLRSQWVIIPSNIGVCFPMFDNRPFFLNIIPSTIQYDNAIETEQEREKEEIRKIIIQRIPHLADGRLLFEPEEAVHMHDGAVGMVRNNKNTSVLTTYANVDSIVSRGSTETANNFLEKMERNIYSQAGVSSEIFSATGGNTTDISIKFDTAVMMYIANKFARFITNIVNSNFANSNINFRYIILPVTLQNEQKYIDRSYKLATAGYSLLVTAIEQGFSQKDFINIKDLENNLLKLTDKLIPPQTAFTQSNATDSEDNGRPAKELEDKKDQTIKNQESEQQSNIEGGSE